MFCTTTACTIKTHKTVPVIWTVADMCMSQTTVSLYANTSAHNSAHKCSTRPSILIQAMYQVSFRHGVTCWIVYIKYLIIFVNKFARNFLARNFSKDGISSRFSLLCFLYFFRHADRFSLRNLPEVQLNTKLNYPFSSILRSPQINKE